MTKTHSLLNAAKVADEFAKKFSHGFDVLEAIPDIVLRHEYDRIDVSTWGDSAGNSISARVGDYHIVSYWDGEDIVFIYQCEPDDEVSEVIGHDPLFSEAL
jgi:hypothetical protein